MALVFRDRPRLGAMSMGSKYSTVPSPAQRGQAPCGLLKEKSCGLGAGRLILQTGQTDSVACSVSPSAPLSGSFTMIRPSP